MVKHLGASAERPALALRRMGRVVITSAMGRVRSKPVSTMRLRMSLWVSTPTGFSSSPATARQPTLAARPFFKRAAEWPRQG